MSAESPDDRKRRVLGRVDRSDFIGRAAELQQILEHARRENAGGLLLLLAPTAGVSELLRQAYDDLFYSHEKLVPICFSLPREGTAVSIAIQFLNTFLSQYISFRRNEPPQSLASATLSELLELAPQADYDWISRLVETYKRERFNQDDDALIRWCLSVAHRLPSKLGRAYVMIDAVGSAPQGQGRRISAEEIIRLFTLHGQPFLVAGLRRELLAKSHLVQCEAKPTQVLKLEKLSEEDGRELVEHVARRTNVPISDEVKDLLVQQFECSPLFITSFMEAASERALALTSYLAGEQLYVDELMGGRFARYFSGLLEDIAPDLPTRKSIFRLLSEAETSDSGKCSVESWAKALRVSDSALEEILRGLHVQEFISRDGSVIQTGGGSFVWKDYLNGRYRLDVANDPRALVVAETITNALKRAPQTMARYYRSKASIGLRQILSSFDGQMVPSILLDYAQFRNVHKGTPVEEIVAALESDTNLLRLPQVVHVASCASYNQGAARIYDEERCAVAHAFVDSRYTDANQVVWLAAEIEAKLEADLDLTKSWFDWLIVTAAEAGFKSSRIWLVAREGFTEDSISFLAQHGAYASSREQFELLTGRLGEAAARTKPAQTADEFEMIVPMGGDNELIVAHTVEEIARRLNFRPEAINQIKHAVVEAFINASEHSLSPERRIYQRFRAEDDKLVITISSRGIVPVPLEARNGESTAPSLEVETLAQRRGLGLSLIRTLMDEVEFESVDDGTSLRMTKYLRP
ncbi:MAG TPA: ATP-binding protein [Pyrinomonadaceae bacterium]|nr:ATP-binding protein [Pyrinomonadaceae bacterium]